MSLLSKEAIMSKALGQRRKRLQENSSTKNNINLNINLNIGTSSKSYQKFCSFETYENYHLISQKKKFSEKMGVRNPFFITHDQVASATTLINNKQYINFSSYNYLNLNSEPRVIKAAQMALERYGVSASASRLVAGERLVHRELEMAIAQLLGTDDALAFVSGYTTNLSTIGYLFGPKDLIIHDELIHDSIIHGIKLSGAMRLSFAHNDYEALDSLLKQRRAQFERVLIVVEGIYSMDGDYPDLLSLIEIKKRHYAFLMVDEAHSIGVLGQFGGGLREHFSANTEDVDLWMGTFSKALAGCGGYIAGCHALIEHLRFAAPGFVYSVGMPPAIAAASLKALNIMQEEPERIVLLHTRSQQFLQAARQAGFSVGLSYGLNIVPIICGSSRKAVQMSNALFELGINVQPIIYPAVPENQARLRFFISCAHTESQVQTTIQQLTLLG